MRIRSRRFGGPIFTCFSELGVRVAFRIGPVERPLHRDGAAASAGLAPAPMRIQPAGDVKWLWLFGLQGSVHVGEILEEIVIPLVGPGFVVAARPVEEEVEHLGDGQPPEGGLGVSPRSCRKEFPVALEGFVAVLPRESDAGRVERTRRPLTPGKTASEIA